MNIVEDKKLNKLIIQHLLKYYSKNDIVEMLKEIEIKNSLSKRNRFHFLLTVGDLLMAHNRNMLALEYYSKGLKVAENIKDKDLYAKGLLHRGKLLMKTNKLKDAEKDLSASRKIMRDESSKNYIDYLLVKRLLLNNKLGQAVRLLQKILTNPHTQKDKNILSNSLMSLSIACLYNGEYDDGIQSIKICVRILEGNGNIKQLAIAHFWAGSLYLARHQTREAEKNFDLSIKISNNLRATETMGLLYLGKAKLQYLKKDHRLSLVYVNKGISIFQKEKNEIMLSEALFLKSLIYKSLKKPKLSDEYLEAVNRTQPTFDTTKNYLIPHLDISFLKHLFEDY